MSATKLSVEQLKAVEEDGNFFLHARPGSGKTRTIAHRIARITTATNVRVAAISYTNVAVNGLADMAMSYGARFGREHFTGTLHEFLMQFVLRPFAHLQPIVAKSPFHVIVDQEWGGWPEIVLENDNRRRLRVSKFHYAADGTPVLYKDEKRVGLRRNAVPQEVIDAVRKSKKKARQMGLVSASDAMFYAMKLLESHPDICHAVAGRFNEILVDEAQDTSDVQLRCLELIHGTKNLASLVLVGDLDQSIYSFQGAQPEKCLSTSAAIGLKTIHLSANFRSSQAICDVACRFCGRTDPDVASGPTAKLSLKPEIMLYRPADPLTALSAFRSRLQDLCIPPNEAVVLARSGTLRDRLNGREDLEELTTTIRVMGSLAAEFQSLGKVNLQTCRSVERAVAALAWDRLPVEGDGAEQLALRETVAELAAALPDVDRDLNEWIELARSEVKRVADRLAGVAKSSPSHAMKKSSKYEGWSAADVFCAREGELRARTVHDVKGETHTAILLVVEKTKGKQDQADLWARPLRGEPVEPEQAEELRIAYVALTRASTYVAVALPEGSDDQPFLSAGFVSMPS